MPNQRPKFKAPSYSSSSSDVDDQGGDTSPAPSTRASSRRPIGEDQDSYSVTNTADLGGSPEVSARTVPPRRAARGTLKPVERTKATLRGHAVTVKKLKQAGYANLDSWEDIVKEIEGPVYVDNGLKWYWVSEGDVKMSSRTVDMLRMCPREFAWFLDGSMKESIDGAKLRRKLKLEVVPLHGSPGGKEVDIKGKQKAI